MSDKGQREAISRRTKEALVIAKAQGVRLGNPRDRRTQTVADKLHVELAPIGL